MFTPQRSQLALAAVVLGFAVAVPAAKATEEAGGWSSSLNAPAASTTTPLSSPTGTAPMPTGMAANGQTPSRTVAMMSPPPVAPRIFAITPERRALLNTIRYAEGTWANGDVVGYRIMFGGGLMDNLDRHPDRVIRSSRYASAAAGAYQFMPFTWAMVTRELGLNGFHPEAQDQGALFLIQRRGALTLADQGQLTPQLAARLAPEWASFPTLAGSSYYGQPVRSYEQLRRFYENNLSELRQRTQQTWEPVAVRQVPPSCDDNTLECKLNSVVSGVSPQ